MKVWLEELRESVIDDRDRKRPPPAGRLDRRRAPSASERKTRINEINAGLRQVYQAVVEEPVPESFRALLASESLGAQPFGRDADRGQKSPQS